MSDLKNKHFFYSTSQADQLSAGTYNRRYPRNFATIDGKTVLYTMMSDERHPDTGWKDLKYLGKGDYLKSEGWW